MKISFNKPAALALAGIGLITGVAATIGLQTHAASSSSGAGQNPAQNKFTPPAASGQVTAVSGNSITLNDKRSGTTYTVDAGAAAIEKFTAPSGSAGANQKTRPAPAAITVSGIQVGDNISVQGTVSGTNIAATKITDGAGFMTGGKAFGRGQMQMGNAGTVSAVSGNTITLTTKDGKTVTVEAQGAKVEKISSINVSGIQVGDSLMVQGKNTNGTISANNIIDGQMPKPAASNQ